MSADPRDQRIAKLEASVEALLQRVEAVEVENRQLRADNATLRVENADLRARLDQTSSNSSKPPSTDGPGVKREPKKPPTGKKPGGQRGHEKHTRELLPVEQVDFVVPVVPDRCGKCQGRRIRRSKDEPRRHQQVELPRPKPVVTEYQCHAVGCLDCGAITVGELPPEAVPVFGERRVPMVVPLLRRYLDFALEHAAGEGDALFKPWGNMNRDILVACKRVGIERCSPNDLRRTCATWLRGMGLQPDLIAAVLGHRDTRMVERVYGRLAPEVLAQRMKQSLKAGSSSNL